MGVLRCCRQKQININLDDQINSPFDSNELSNESNNEKDNNTTTSTIKKPFSIDNPIVYQRMLNGDSIEKLFLPQSEQTNEELFILFVKVFNMIEVLGNDERIISLRNYVVYGMTNTINYINENNIFNIKPKDNDLKSTLLELIYLIAEIYHFLMYKISNMLSPYDNDYWKDITHIELKMKDKVFECTKRLQKIKELSSLRFSQLNKNDTNYTFDSQTLENKQKFTINYIENILSSDNYT